VFRIGLNYAHDGFASARMDPSQSKMQTIVFVCCSEIDHEFGCDDLPEFLSLMKATNPAKEIANTTRRCTRRIVAAQPGFSGSLIH
jgi:hypothetical protein